MPDKTQLGVKLYTYIMKQENAFAQKYPLVNMKEPDIAGKITGMLLSQPEPNLVRLNEQMSYMVRRIVKAFSVLEEFYVKEMTGVSDVPVAEVNLDVGGALSPVAESREDSVRHCRCYIDLAAPGITSGQLREALIEVHKIISPAWCVDGRKPPFIAPILEILKPNDYKEITSLAAKIAPLTIALRETLITEVGDGGGWALHAMFHAPEFESHLKDNFLRNVLKMKPGTPEAAPHDTYRGLLNGFKCHAFWTVAVVKKRYKVCLERAKQLLDEKYKSLFMASKQIVFDDGRGNKRKIHLQGQTTFGGMSLSALTQAAWRYKNHEFKSYAETIKANVAEFGGSNIERVKGISWTQTDASMPAGSSSGAIDSGASKRKGGGGGRRRRGR